MAPNGGISNRRALLDHTITGRSGAASGSTTDGKSASAASEAVISICSQQICRRSPNGIQHWAYTRSASARSPAPLSRTTIVRAGCSGISAAIVSPSAAASSLASASTTRVKVQARSTPAPPSRPFAQRDPQVRQLAQNVFGSHGGHYGFLHACPRRASISSAAAGPHVPAA